MSLKIDNVTFIYDPDTAFSKKALSEVSAEFRRGEFAALLGATGSGKSTLIRLLNGLLRPSEGHVRLDGEDIWQRGYDRRALRFRVGMVFQYPEHQLFEETVLKDVCFGPSNKGLPEEDRTAAAKRALRLTGLPEELWDKSPFALSGGERRRAAIAGVLAMEPEYLILDEPAAGLDPKGRREILQLLKSLQAESNTGILLVSHSMEDAAEYADRILVIDRGRIRMDDTPASVFSRTEELKEFGLDAPDVSIILKKLSEAGFPVNTGCFSVKSAAEEIARLFAEKTAAGR